MSASIKMSKPTDTLILAFNNQQMLPMAMECRGGLGGDDDNNGISNCSVRQGWQG